MSEQTSSRTVPGLPCWYELNTPDLDATTGFYQSVLGWQVGDPGVPGFQYRVGMTDSGSVAGFAQGDSGSGWVLYFEVADADQTASEISAAGGQLLVPPTDIPGTGRFAIATDPSGATFGILQPQPMEAPAGARAYSPSTSGHGGWQELVSSDPQAALAFYQKVFGWTTGQNYQMDGEEGFGYQLVGVNGDDFGAVTGLQHGTRSEWGVIFTVDAVDAVTAKVEQAGGKLTFGPMEVPGGFAAYYADPQGNLFGVSASTR